MKYLSIGIIAPISERVPPKKYGGTERVIHALTEELVLRGHDVTLFASGDSQTSAKLVSIYPRSLREAKLKDPYGVNDWTLLNIGTAYMQQEKFDIIHDHTAPFSLPAAQLSTTPVIMTLHGAFNPQNRRLFETFTKPYFVTISKAQSNPAPNVNILSTIYNGLPMDHYPFGKKHDGYLLYTGRIAMEKGTHFAIDVAVDINLPLIIAAKLDPQDQAYFEEYVEPRLSNDHIKWIGEVDENERNNLMKNAICLLHPVTWREPFGLTMIESMSCGCPVVAFDKGSIAEVVSHGKTGFVVNDVEEMIAAVANINTIDRNECRRYALENFNTKRMADNYEEVYYQILEKRHILNNQDTRDNNQKIFN